MRRSRFLSVLLLLSLAAVARAIDPVGEDIAIADPAFPPKSPALRIPTADGAKLNGLLYQAAGPGRHPVVILCHGYPGNERNLDLAQALRRAGYHVVSFNYRGSWGTGGAFTLGHGLEDTRHVLAFVRSPAAVEKYGFDPAAVALIGHSYGGWVSLMLAAEDPGIRAVVTLAAWNPTVVLTLIGTDTAKRADWVKSFGGAFDPESGPLRGGSGEAIIAEIEQHRADYDHFLRAAQLRDKNLLLFGGRRDVFALADYHEPFVRALAAANASNVTNVVLDDDHPFSAHRQTIARQIIAWLPGALEAQK